MTVYRMEDGVVNTDKALASWDEATFWDGHNHISKATGSQWSHQRPFKSRKSRYYLVHSSQWEGSHPHAEFVSPQEAARWLLHNEHELPADLAPLEEQVSE